MAKAPKAPQPPDPKQPEITFRTKPVAERSIWESWAVLPAKTRLHISLAITVFAAAGILVSNRLEKAFPAQKDAQTPPKTSPPS